MSSKNNENKPKQNKTNKQRSKQKTNLTPPHDVNRKQRNTQRNKDMKKQRKKGRKNQTKAKERKAGLPSMGPPLK